MTRIRRARTARMSSSVATPTAAAPASSPKSTSWLSRSQRKGSLGWVRRAPAEGKSEQRRIPHGGLSQSTWMSFNQMGRGPTRCLSEASTRC